METRTQRLDQAASKPLIGVTGSSSGGFFSWLLIKWAIFQAGGQAVRVTPDHQVSAEHLDGLVLSGGEDINLLSEESHGVYVDNQSIENANSSLWQFKQYMKRMFSFSKAYFTDTKRDKMERRLLVEMLRKDVPILGICRGAQLINVEYGGTLHKDIRPFYDDPPYSCSLLPKKQIVIDKDSQLYNTFETESCKVNSLHHQAIDKNPKGIEVVAREMNQLPQAIEVLNQSFVLGVQWHPEYLLNSLRQRSLFKKLVSLAKAFKPPHAGWK